jgi:hypothetical protein
LLTDTHRLDLSASCPTAREPWNESELQRSDHRFGGVSDDDEQLGWIGVDRGKRLGVGREVPAVTVLPDLIGGDQCDDRRDVVGDSPSNGKLSAGLADARQGFDPVSLTERGRARAGVPPPQRFSGPVELRLRGVSRCR